MVLLLRQEMNEERTGIRMPQTEHSSFCLPIPLSFFPGNGKPGFLSSLRQTSMQRVCDMLKTLSSSVLFLRRYFIAFIKTNVFLTNETAQFLF